MLIDNYFELKCDYDYHRYYFLKSDVLPYDRSIDKINVCLDHYRKMVDSVHSPFIIGNYICFTFKGVKYYDSLSCVLDEERLISYLFRKLRFLGCYDCYYKFGRLD